MPDGTAAGQYVLHYVWRGYRDCIDVDLLPAALELPDTSDAKYGYEVLRDVFVFHVNHPTNANVRREENVVKKTADSRVCVVFFLGSSGEVIC